MPIMDEVALPMTAWIKPIGKNDYSHVRIRVSAFGYIGSRALITPIIYFLAEPEGKFEM